MKRAVVLGMIAGLGCLTLVVSAFQAPSPAALAASKIEKVKDNLYVITGSGASDLNSFSGGTTAVFITDSGVVLVDTKLPGWGPTIIDRIKSVTNKPVTTIINTHTHDDHVGSNQFFGANVETIVHENTKANMAKMDEFKGDKAKFLPKRTYKDKLTLGTGKDEVDLFYFGPGHTNGDTFVIFPAIRTMHVGDMFAWKAIPYIDTENGGSITGHAATLGRVVNSVKNVDTIINGHIPATSWNELKEYADFTQDFVTWATNEMKAGKTVDQAAAEYKVPARFKGYVVTVNQQFANVKGNVQTVYNELKK
jgi:glyoxylase-like metal-dependent hydrolase (beta-lactamase superfamily II)